MLFSGCRGWPTNTLSYVDTRESFHFQDSRPQHCRHSYEQDTSGRLGVLLSSQRALQGVRLLSSHIESVLPSFSLLSSDQHCRGWTVCSVLPSLASSFSLPRFLFLSSSPTVYWIGNSLEQEYSCQMHRRLNRIP